MKTDLTGQRFGRWTCLSRSKIKKYGTHISYNCRCDCGTERVVGGTFLRNGHSRSCGCAFIEGAANSQRTHGLTGHRLAGTWRSMKERCYNKNHLHFADYGGRGIYVCERWHSLENFVLDNDLLAKPGTTIDRKDNDGPYSPDNCRWASRKAQANNRRNNRMIEFRGETLPISVWAERFKINRTTIDARLLSGWLVEDALTTPARQYK